MRPAAVILALACLAAPAARADTILHLSVTASVTTMPDELAAQLTANADAPTAGAAQQQVNQMVDKALGTAKGLTAVTASTTQYSVWHETDPKDVWHASQGVALRSTDGGRLLTLVGQLQQDGLAVGDLRWQLSPAASETVGEDGGPPAPMGMMRMMAVAPAAASPPPSAQADVVTVSATVSGEAKLVTAP
jgi:predicted secreted protein